MGSWLLFILMRNNWKLIIILTITLTNLRKSFIDSLLKGLFIILCGIMIFLETGFFDGDDNGRDSSLMTGMLFKSAGSTDDALRRI